MRAPAFQTETAPVPGVSGPSALRVRGRVRHLEGREDAEVGFYAYHRWAAPLARRLPNLVAARLAGTPGLRSIEPAAPGRRYEARFPVPQRNW